MADIYGARTYREFLRKSFPGKGDGRGRRGELARALKCQTSLISLVLTDRAHLNEDMAFATARFLGLGAAETEFFLLLYHHERAAGPALRQHYLSKIREAQAKREQVTERIGRAPTLSTDVQARYYSDWTYSAIHTAVMNPETRTLERLAQKLRLPPSLVEEQLKFLTEWKFVYQIGSVYEPGVTRVHLPSDSPFITQHHRNWHIEAMRAVGERRERDLNYSGALSLSRADAEKVRAILLDALTTIEKQIAPSPDEEIVGVAMSLFHF